MKRMLIHSHFLPALQRALSIESDTYRGENFYEERLCCLSGAIVFDCTKLPAEFVRATGEVAWEEYKQTGRRVKLPFEACYFEFEGALGLVAHHTSWQDGEDDGDSVEFRSYVAWDTIEETAEFISPEFGEFHPFHGEDGEIPEDVDPFFAHVNSTNVAADVGIERAAKLLLGVLSLLNEHLLGSELNPDPHPVRSAKLKKQDRPPTSSDVRVLTINAAAVRRAAVTPTGSHESPRLHWRRGHWRVLHRGSEFESRAWVNKCLVGDLERGFIAKDYRLVWHQPMLQPIEPAPFSSVIESMP